MQASSSKLKPAQDPISGSESEPESDYSSSDVTEDEDGDELTPALDAAILRTLSKIKRKEGVYGKENVLQEELKKAQERAEAKGIKASVVKKVAEKPYLLQDYHRAKLLSGNIEDDEEEQGEPLTYVQSRRKLQEEAISAFNTLASDDDESDDGGFIKKREKDEGEEEMEDQEYRQFLLEMGGGEDEVRKILGMGDQPVSVALEEIPEEDGEEKEAVLSKAEKVELQPKKKVKKEKKAKKDDEFLMNYILNRGWIDKSENHVPTYKEVVGDDDESAGEEEEGMPKAGPSSHPWGELDEEDEFDDKADAFEAEYNFRFEEPGAANILSHPRQIDALVRRPDDARKTKRARRAERKAAEKAAQEEALKAKKGSKRREMEKRMASLKSDLAAEGVDGDVDWDSLQKVLDGEWNENEWEKVVGGMLSKAGEKEDENEDGKPVWDDDIGDAEYDDMDEDGGFQYNQDGECMDVDMEGAYGQDDGPINMDADFIDEEPSKKKRKRDKKKNKKERNVEEPEIEDQQSMTLKDKAQAVKEVMEEYKALDHEDIIGGDLPTKFKYTKSAPVSFGLTPVEILLATDEELNKVLSVKSIAPYRKGGIGHQGKGLGQRVRELKEDLRKRKWGQDESEKKPWKEGGAEHAAKKAKVGGEGEGGEKRSKKRKGKKERKRAVEAGGEGGVGEAQV
ncbi:hypothetical protein I302_108893 [Kwoniella bestiolae CBS 10118]|uniref:Protein KRI1 n=1 Tax=Kwoniella bestiolae CBS 10118 TaxID=1296100 RepID=A0A1B9FUD2_9TREE|nr:protein KRI1 [Kwoniella bestiolae CBS 10118]OCF22383.1 protein KRI1 [Kwoniella bestiolae CBS 10118]